MFALASTNRHCTANGVGVGASISMLKVITTPARLPVGRNVQSFHIGACIIARASKLLRPDTIWGGGGGGYDVDGM